MADILRSGKLLMFLLRGHCGGSALGETMLLQKNRLAGATHMLAVVIGIDRATCTAYVKMQVE